MQQTTSHGSVSDANAKVNQVLSSSGKDSRENYRRITHRTTSYHGIARQICANIHMNCGFCGKSTKIGTNENLSVQDFVESVNSTIRQKHEQARLSNIIDRIESYDVLESNNDDIDKKIKEFCQLDLTRPMPGITVIYPVLQIFEIKIDVHCFLFTDMLLVCKPTSKTKRAERVKELYKKAKETKFDNKGLKLDEECYYDSNISYLPVSGRSPRDSSRPSLMHSNSGSTDMSDSVPPPLTTTPNCHTRGISLEFGEPRGYSMSSDEGSPDQNFKSRGDWRGSRHQISPKLERRSFLMKSASSTGPGSPVSSNMLTVNHAYQFSDTREVKSFDDSVQPPSLAVPANKMHLFPDARRPNHHNFIRSMPVLNVGNNKPPLVKTKNISHANSTSALGDQFSTEFAHYDHVKRFVGYNVFIFFQHSETDSAEECHVSAVKSRRNGRHDRRYYTADTLETIKHDINKDSNLIQKRFSWNYGGQTCGQHPGHGYRLLQSWSKHKCYSSDSIHSSSTSGVSSCCSGQGSDCDATRSSNQNTYIGESSSTDTSASNFNQVQCKEEEILSIDVGEVQEGISSVKIKLPNTSSTTKQEKATKADLIRMKHLLLTDNTCDAT
ncbi:Pleckstrin y domain-containing family G member 5 [Nymphon striatum]|nr:Pleckstrin y domain-containing family G member 5 [Nymphon striatum]